MKLTVSLVAFFVFAFFAFGSVKADQNVDYGTHTFNKGLTQDSAGNQQKKTGKKENIGIGPVKEVKLGPINKALAKEGENIFNSKCFACHRLKTKLVGPALTPIVKKTNAVYLMNYLLNTTEMQTKEPELKKLIKQYNGIVMPEQYLNKKKARAVLEYLRSKEK